MSWLYKSLCILLLAAVTSCGFTPIHAKKSGEMYSALEEVEIAPVSGREGQILKTELETLLNQESTQTTPLYRLESSVAVSYIPIIIESDGTVSRYRIDITIPLSLHATDTGAELFTSRVRRSVSYTVSESDYTSYISSTDATERGIQEAAHDVAQRVSAFLVKQ